ncbi:MAG: plasmid pRiA4b ORF-3 family protein [Chloroflexi bacterium]|nr:MAG: plasmid pRiA4b ORF-3 family protein [Chloroflexota bacterium]
MAAKKKRKRKRKRRQRKQVSRPAPPPLAVPPPEDFDFADIWDIGIPQDPEEAIAAFQEALEAGKLDAEDAFEWLNHIRDALGQDDPQARARFGALMDQLRQQAPEAYADAIPYFIDNLIGDAIADGHWEDIPNLLVPFVEAPDAHAELFYWVIDQLLYHGQMEVLRDAMRSAWPRVRDSEKLFDWAIDEFAGQAMLAELLVYLETTEHPRADDPALLEATKSYGERQDGWLEYTIPRLTASAPASWEPAHFDETVDAEQWHENLRALLLDFVADRWRAGMPLSRGYMAYRELVEFLSWQFSNPSVADDSGDRAHRRRGKGRKKRRGKKQPAPQPSESGLVPRHALLDRFVAEKFPFLSAQPYKAAALMEAVPAYLHFLARLNLIHPTEMDAALEELLPLMEYLPRILRSYGADPVAVRNVTSAWAEESLAALRDDPALASARATPPPMPAAPTPAPAAQPGALETYTFKVTYLEKPNVWRVIEIAGDQTLDDLHYAIQAAVNFDADHLYSFFMSGRAWDDATEYASPYAEGRSAAGVKIRDLGLRLKQRFLYLFDYGDEHRFEVQLLAVNPDAPKGKYPRVVERHGRNPEQYPEW